MLKDQVLVEGDDGQTVTRGPNEFMSQESADASGRYSGGLLNPVGRRPKDLAVHRQQVDEDLERVRRPTCGDLVVDVRGELFHRDGNRRSPRIEKQAGSAEPVSKRGDRSGDWLTAISQCTRTLEEVPIERGVFERSLRRSADAFANDVARHQRRRRSSTRSHTSSDHESQQPYVTAGYSWEAPARGWDTALMADGCLFCGVVAGATFPRALFSSPTR